jgi:phosphoglucosamine mutase
MNRQLFGTDGIRGVAGDFPLDARTVYAFGAALGGWAVRHDDPAVLIGMDTRESGPELAEHVAAGLASVGARVSFAGVVTTPGVAWLTRNGPFAAGVMISASHNPYQDNGLKVFGHSGYKLPDDEEHALETDIFQLLEGNLMPRREPVVQDSGLDARYIDYLASTFTDSLAGVQLVVDCANGAASYLAPALFERLGASVDRLSCAPDGRNINLACGAPHVESLTSRSVSRRAVGIAFDGDADRCIMVAPSGKVIDGDHQLLLAAADLHKRGKLPGPTVVATVMSNLGLERALKARGIALKRTPVGDKYVLEEMLRGGEVLGGEQSGHVIFLDYATTGDGLLTALRVLEIMRRTSRSLEELTADLHVYPQKLVNVRVARKRPLADLDEVGREIRAAESQFGDTGRVLVRFSGTEPLARVMVEGPDLAQVEGFAQRIAAAIQRELA